MQERKDPRDYKRQVSERAERAFQQVTKFKDGVLKLAEDTNLTEGLFIMAIMTLNDINREAMPKEYADIERTLKGT